MITTVQKYDKSKGLLQPVSYKVARFLELGCITKRTNGVSFFYECAPIPGYNKTMYTIRETLGELFCNCQGFRKKGSCSHTSAVRIYKQKTENPDTQMRLF
jgi:hypothetical protein